MVIGYFECNRPYTAYRGTPYLFLDTGRASDYSAGMPRIARVVAAGLPHHPGMQGRSLWPMLTGPADLSRHREDVYCEYYTGSPCQGPHGRYLTMTATERWKLIAAHGAGGELYDLAGDPAETHNLWDSPDHLAVKAEMLQRLADRMALTADPLPQPQSPW